MLRPQRWYDRSRRLARDVVRSVVKGRLVLAPMSRHLRRYGAWAGAGRGGTVLGRHGLGPAPTAPSADASAVPRPASAADSDLGVVVGEAAADDGERRTGRRHRVWRFARPVVFLLLGLLALRIVVGLVGAVDWGQVASSFGRLSAWMAVPLVVDLLLRQSMNAVPLAQYVPGLRLGRSVQNDLTANLMGTVAPPPADMVLRVAMFRSWGLDPVMGMAGVTLNMITFYSVRFVAPVLGIALLVFQGVERRQWLLAAASAAIAAILLGGLLLLLKGDTFAAWMGRSAGRVVRRIRSSTDPEGWAVALVDIRTRSADNLRRGLLRSLAALVGMVLCDAFLLFLALRFVGVGADALSVVDIIGTFLVAYPLTIMPLFGFGVLDAVLLGTWVTIAGTAYEPEIVAGLVVWRTVTILGPLVLGLVTFALWRRRYGSGVSLRELRAQSDRSAQDGRDEDTATAP